MCVVAWEIPLHSQILIFYSSKKSLSDILALNMFQLLYFLEGIKHLKSVYLPKVKKKTRTDSNATENPL